MTQARALRSGIRLLAGGIQKHRRCSGDELLLRVSQDQAYPAGLGVFSQPGERIRRILSGSDKGGELTGKAFQESRITCAESQNGREIGKLPGVEWTKP